MLTIIVISAIFLILVFGFYRIFKKEAETQLENYHIVVEANGNPIYQTVSMPIEDILHLSVKVFTKEYIPVKFCDKFTASSSEPTTAKVLPGGRDLMSSIFASECDIFIRSRNRRYFYKQDIFKFTLHVLPGSPSKINIIQAGEIEKTI